MKTIVGLPWNLDWDISGLAKQLGTCFNTISNLGVDLKVFSLGSATQKTKFSFESVPVKTMPEDYIFSSLVNSIAFSQEFAKKVAKEKYDILHCFNTTSLFLTDKKFLFQTQDPTPGFMLDAVKGEYPKTLKYQKLLRYYTLLAELFKPEYEQAEVIVSLSNVTKENIIKYYQVDESKIEVIPNGVLPEECAAEKRVARSEGMKIVLYPSTIQVKKGFHYLVEAMTQVRKIYPETILVVCGRIHPNEYELFKDLIERKRKDSAIVLTGYLPREQLFKWYRKADVCCIPKIYGNMSNAILEAVAQGLPIVTTRHSGFPEIEKVGIQIPPKDPNAIAEAIIALLSDLKLWRKKSENSQKVIKNYHWNTLAKKFVDVYTRLLE